MLLIGEKGKDNWDLYFSNILKSTNYNQPRRAK